MSNVRLTREINMNRLVIIGNGFDIAHGLPTKYWDFLSRLSEKHEKFYDMVCQYIPSDALWYSFEEALGYLDDEQLKEDNSCYMLGYGDENWRDSANHDYQYMINEALSFGTKIPKYFREWICDIDTNAKPVFSRNIINKNSLFLNFNYTDTLERAYGIPKGRILYIHGKALRGDNLIVGHHDATLFQENPEQQFQTEEEYYDYYDNCDEDFRITEANEIIRSYYRNTYKDTDSIIRANKNFFDSLVYIEEIYILGHSLSDIDSAYFNEIKRKVSSNCRWYISYHSDNDLYNAQRFVADMKLRCYELVEV